MQLVVTETNLKARTLGSMLRTHDPSGEWQTVSLEGFDMEWPKKGIGIDESQLYPKLTVRKVKTAFIQLNHLLRREPSHQQGNQLLAGLVRLFKQLPDFLGIQFNAYRLL